MKLLITGGGTGGHLAIAKSLKDAALKAGHECIYIGSTSGQDLAWFQEDEDFLEKHFFKTSGVINKRGFSKLSSLFLTLKATIKALKIVKKVDAVISVGGFSAAPASFAGVLLRKPYFIHEQNAAIGRLNRLLRPYTKAFFTSYEEASLVKDYPVRERFFQGPRIRSRVKTVIFIGGSQGARYINELALKIAPLLQENKIRIIHQAGSLELEKVKAGYEDLGIEADVFDFRSDLDRLMQESDLAISRAGASTLWELAASCLPALYIPYPYAASDHQFYNAAHLVEKNASWLARQEDDPYTLLSSLLQKDMRETSEKLRGLIKPHGADKIIQEVENVR